MIRLFSKINHKGTIHYLDTQKKYEIIRTVIYFGISISLFIAGYTATRTKVNLLTIIAVLGCLPASKSAVSMIMHLRYHSCPQDIVEQTEQKGASLVRLYDMVFTSYEKNYQVDCIVLKGNTLCGYTSHEACDCHACEKHLSTMMMQDGLKNYTVKIWNDSRKFLERTEQLNQGETEHNDTLSQLRELLLSISL